MTRLAAIFVALVLLTACNHDVSPPPGPDVQPSVPVVGHWNLEGSVTGAEHLWIELSGTFTEAGGPMDIAAGTLSQIVSAGSWRYSAQTLTLDDARTGAHTFSAVIQEFGAVLILSDRHSYRFDRDSADAGADH